MSSTAASTSSSQNISNRLGRYAVIAAAIPAASVHAAIVTDSFQTPVLVNNSTGPVDIDFGAQFGEVFRFQFNRYTDFGTNTHTYFGDTYIYRFRSAANAVMNFNNAYNYNGAPSAPTYASFVNFNPQNFYYGGNDPVRLGKNQVISYGLSFTDFDYYRSDNHDLFNKYFSYGVTNYGDFELSSGSYGQWRPGQRGYLAFAFFEDGDGHLGYFDVGMSANGQNLIIYGWAFNTTVGGSITAVPLPAPGPVGLAALAMGAAGVRRKRRSTVA